MPLEIAVQRVQRPPWSIHVAGSSGTVQLEQLNRQFGGMGRLNSSFASSSEKLLDSTVPEALDHAYSVARHFSHVKKDALNASRAEGAYPTAGVHINRSASTSTTRLRRGTPACSACASMPRNAALRALRDDAFKIR